MGHTDPSAVVSVPIGLTMNAPLDLAQQKRLSAVMPGAILHVLKSARVFL
jgi:hypothetical protein